MEIKQTPIGEIKNYEKNPRKNNLAAHEVAMSIRKFGFRSPILLDKNNVIIAGHTRLKAANILQMLSVPTIQITDLSEAQIKALRIADNKVAEKAEWDKDLLRGEFLELEELDFDLEDTGFDLRDIGDILDVEDKDETGIENVDKLGSHLIECPKCNHKFKKGEK